MSRPRDVTVAAFPLTRAGRTVRTHKWLMPMVVVALAALIGWLVPTRDFLILPGEAIGVSKLVTVASGQSPPTKGELFLVTVYSAPANGDEWLFGHVFPHARLAPARTQLPANTSFDAFQREEARMMTDSQTTAKVVALRQLGYAVTVRGQGAIVRQVEQGSPAAQAGIQRGDVITAVAGKAVGTADQLIGDLRSQKPGSRLKVTVAPHGGKELRQVELTLAARPDNPSAGFLGVVAVTDRPRYDFPVDVKIDAQGIIGPSAGLALTLEIIEKLSPTDITHGKKIAATGTMALNGHVGRIGDVEEKVVAAEGKADYFLVPKGDQAAAQKQAGRLKVVGIDSLQQALDFLRSLS